MLMGSGAADSPQLRREAQGYIPAPVPPNNAQPWTQKNLESLKSAIADLEEMLRSDQADVQLEATKKFRQLLSVERDALVQDVLDRDIVPQLLHFLKQNGHAALQVEALWALTNIAAGATEHTHLLLKNDAVPTLVSLLGSTHQEVLEQAVWVLGNIAGDGTPARDKVLEAQVLAPLLKCMQDVRETSLLRIATWTLSNLCDGQPRPDLDMQAVLGTLGSVLQSDDTEVLSHACWALSHLCDGPSPHIEAVVEANVCPRLVELLHNKSWRVVKPALRTVGNIVCAEDEQDYTQQIIECGAVPCLKDLISHSNRDIQKEACWTLSNIAAGTIEQIQQVLDSGSIPTLVKLASKDADTDPDVKIEACWVLLNATSCGSDPQIEHLVREGCVAVLCNLLQDNSMVMMALEGLEKILQVGEETTTLPSTGTAGPPLNASEDDAAAAAARQDDAHSILLTADKIQDLQKHRNTQIGKRATRMWKQYFVICAICQHPYSKQSPATKFCAECKCNVCVRCDCSRFHLSYQETLWKEFAEDESRNKKSKRQKKKSKDRKRKDAQRNNNNNNNSNSSSKAAAESSSAASTTASNASAQEKGQTKKPDSQGGVTESAPGKGESSATVVETAVEPPDPGKGDDGEAARKDDKSTDTAVALRNTMQTEPEAVSVGGSSTAATPTPLGARASESAAVDKRETGKQESADPAATSSSVHTKANGIVSGDDKNKSISETSNNNSNSSNNNNINKHKVDDGAKTSQKGGVGHGNDGNAEVTRSSSPEKAVNGTNGKTTKVSTPPGLSLSRTLDEDKDTLTAHNDVYVDFLNNKGSILDLWKIMGDDGGSEPDEELLLLQRQAQAKQQQK
ncbi:Importin subunit alpha [Hondaea fermentalgiana]|uniref:Importin subunit alpha n=1 Tax=Hondaea fermentalgiana TaxID=2315210 RepID=A0A2R5GQG1_9STRA|nr:Importin subunit alpha [Hondaea fermentalgiana]|eukprot:GBG33116.1 Importin subunit alpha [Hondaea fermentalgiana]